MLNAPRKAVEVKAKQAWCLTFEPPVPEVMNGFKNLFGHYDRIYTSYYGCPNIEQYFPGEAIIKIDLNQFWYPKFVIHEMKKTDFDKLDYRKYKIPKFRP